MFKLKNQNFYIVLLLAVISAVFIGAKNCRAVSLNVSPDAIAIRVLKNEEHFSARRWYVKNNFTGSPQSLLVDGYEAVRDGRTVYVNAANIVNSVLYTNIYIISYNQGSEQPTLDIFAQVLANWKFNADQTNPGFCSAPITINCLRDNDCPLGEYCLSQKGRIIRDTKRMADLAEIKIFLNDYKARSGFALYPKLESGTYLPGKTISVWPSWNKLLSQLLIGSESLPHDPVNKLIGCLAPYNEITCWDEIAKRMRRENHDHVFGSSTSAGDKVYVYETREGGISYRLCAFMESNYVSEADGACQAPLARPNNAPIISCGQPAAYAGRPYTGFVMAYDPDGDALINWTLVKNGDWSSWIGGPDEPEATSLINQKKLTSAQAGAVGIYNFTILVSDLRGEMAVRNCDIIVSPPLNILTAAVGHLYGYWVDPVFNPPRNYCNGTSFFIVFNNYAAASGATFPTNHGVIGSLTTPPCVSPTNLRPNGVIITPSGSAQITLSWDPVPDVLHYNVRLDSHLIYRYNDPLYFTPLFPPGAHYLVEDGITVTSLNNVQIVYPGPVFGTIISSDDGINCGNDCTQRYNANESVTLTAVPVAGAGFYGWGGDCASAGTNLNCLLTIDTAKTVTAAFYPPMFTLRVIKNQANSGLIRIDHRGYEALLNCSSLSECTLNTYSGAGFNMTAEANPGFVFSGWSGEGCAGAGICEVLLDRNKTINANFSCLRNCSGRVCGSDGCGGSCGNCLAGQMCNALGQCVCAPTTCLAQGRNCGTIADGCGGTLNCGACTAPQTCGGGGTSGVCGCTPETDAAFCIRHSRNCGDFTAIDNCGLSRTANCGACTAPQTCGGGGTSGVCGCTPETDAAFCIRHSRNCGLFTASDNCGIVRNAECGVCTAPQTCGGGGTSGVCGCTPNCVGRICGSDGCGGSCGLCGMGYLCTNGSCCPQAANIQICADNEHTTYFNGAFVGSQSNWQIVDPYDITVIPGENVMAIRAADWGAIYGVSVKLNQTGCLSMTTAELSSWKCTGTLYGGWNEINFDDSAWPTAIQTTAAGPRAGNYLDVPMIWAADANWAGTTVYCRYTFNTE